MLITISPKVRYNSFGFIPTGHSRYDLAGKLFGHPNLLKRLQARDIIQALDIQPTDVILDFGCGAGYFTVEMAKLASKAYGIDINPYVKAIKIPSILQDRLEYFQVSGTQLPFENGYFDRILASEILPMIPEPNLFLQEMKRVLKLGGRLVISNGAGHPAIRKAFANNSLWLRWLKNRYPERMPKTYEDYCAMLQKSFGTGRSDFLQEHDIRQLLEENSFQILKVSYTPGYLAGAYLSWTQFLLYLRTGQTLSQHNFALNYVFWSFVRLFELKTYRGGVLCVAQSI